MMRKSKYALWALLVLAVLAAGSTMASLARSESASAANSEIYRQLELFGEVLERVNSDYVERPDNSKLIEAASSAKSLRASPLRSRRLRMSSVRSFIFLSFVGFPAKTPNEAAQGDIVISMCNDALSLFD